MNTYKHSGTFGDLIYSLPMVKHFGAGKFYLHLNQIDWIGQHYYGSQPAAFHQGRMTEADFEYMKRFMLAQDYITEFAILDRGAEITHNLDKFRPLFVGHPGNYVDVYCEAFDIKYPATRNQLRNTAWLSVHEPRQSDNRTVVINRTARWLPGNLNPRWHQWREQGLETKAVFIGLTEEYLAFKRDIGWNIPYQPVTDMLNMAEYIAGAEQFIGNQSAAFAIAAGLKHPNAWCEMRRDLPQERNECCGFNDVVYF
jgi:hypothetical protein